MAKKSKDYTVSVVFGWQKVKFYKIKHFIFDFGGVLLIEKTHVMKILFQIIGDDLGFNIYLEDKKALNKLRRQLRSGLMGAREFLENLLISFYYPSQKIDGSLPPKKVNIDYYLELWIELYMQLTHLNPDMEEIIQRLHQSGYKVSLMSNTIDIHAKGNQLKGFYDMFDNVFLSNEIGLRKPDIEQYKYVLEKLDTTPEKCIFIDDKLKNLVPARELGIIVMKFESIEKFKAQLDELGIVDLSKETRKEIKKKYLAYKKVKKEYKSAKKEFIAAEERYLHRRNKSLKKTQVYLEKKAAHLQKLGVYEEIHSHKKQELQKKMKFE